MNSPCGHREPDEAEGVFLEVAGHAEHRERDGGDESGGGDGEEDAGGWAARPGEAEAEDGDGDERLREAVDEARGQECCGVDVHDAEEHERLGECGVDREAEGEVRVRESAVLEQRASLERVVRGVNAGRERGGEVYGGAHGDGEEDDGEHCEEVEGAACGAGEGEGVVVGVGVGFGRDRGGIGHGDLRVALASCETIAERGIGVWIADGKDGGAVTVVEGAGEGGGGEEEGAGAGEGEGTD